jgi:hypothetical protein
MASSSVPCIRGEGNSPTVRCRTSWLIFGFSLSKGDEEATRVVTPLFA